MLRRRSLLSLALAVPLIASLVPTIASADAGASQAPTTYTVMTTPSTGSVNVASVAPAVASARGMGVQVTKEFNALGGFQAVMTADQAAKIAQQPGITGVYPSREMTTFADQPTTKVLSWGLDRIDQVNPLPLDDVYSPPNRGKGVHVYVVDGGIMADHPDFDKSRIGKGWDYVDNDNTPVDCAGHGTHVSSTIGGKRAGVANQVTLHELRVTNCEGKGPDSRLAEVADWLLKNIERPAVVNMSLGTELKAGEASVIDPATQRLLDANITVVAAAGNSRKDACNVAPARVPGAITVGATSEEDDRAFFSNRGKCLDVFAPGWAIWGADYRNKEFTLMDGTSMAAPHVAGAAAIVLSANPGATPDQVSRAITDNAISVVKDEGKDSTKLFLQVQNLGKKLTEPAPTPKPTPTTKPTPTNEPTADPTSDPAPGGEVAITNDNIDEVLGRSSQTPTIVVVGATWSKMTKASLEKFRAKLSADNQKWVLARVDGDLYKKALARFNVKGYPTIMGYKNGSEMTDPGRYSDGSRNQAQVDAFVDDVVRSWGSK